MAVNSRLDSNQLACPLYKDRGGWVAIKDLREPSKECWQVDHLLK